MNMMYRRLRHDLQQLIKRGVQQRLKLFVVASDLDGMIIRNHLGSDSVKFLVDYETLV